MPRLHVGQRHAELLDHRYRLPAIDPPVPIQRHPDVSVQDEGRQTEREVTPNTGRGGSLICTQGLE